VSEKAGDVIGRYKLLQQIGEGGCGVVYMAEQEEPVRRRVALKVIKLGMDTKQVIARFEAERQALAVMDHPNIAKVLDAGATETGRPYFVMELVRGIKITDYCGGLAEGGGDCRKAAGANRRPGADSVGQADNVGNIKSGLVLAPITFQSPGVLDVHLNGASSNTVSALEREEIPDEAHLQPRVGESVVIDGVKRVWTETKWEDGKLDFNRFLGTMTEWSVGYGVCYLQSDHEQTGLVMKVGRDDYAKIYLNGKQIYRREEGGPAEEAYTLDMAAWVQLKRGSNTLVFKVANEEGGWFSSVRFTDAAGQLPKGIHVTLTAPEAGK
jgi:hypothetical protein